MEEMQKTKDEIRNDISKMWNDLSEKEIEEKNKEIENRLFEFANFLEAKIALLYIHHPSEIRTGSILKRCIDYNKILVLPVINSGEHGLKLIKINSIDTDLKRGPDGIMAPDTIRCKTVPIECIDIAMAKAANGSPTQVIKINDQIGRHITNLSINILRFKNFGI